MKISVNDEPLYVLSDTQKKVIKHDVLEEIFEDDMKRRLQWVLMHKHDQAYARLKEEWDKKLAENGVRAVPTDPEQYAKLVFEQPNYRSYKQKMAQ